MLLYFIIGMLFISLGVPILDNLVSIFSAITQFIVYSFAFKIYKVKKAMGVNQDQKQEEEINTQVIGFNIDSDELFDNQEE